MTEKTHEISIKESQDMKSVTHEQKLFTNKVTRLNALACNFTQQDNFDLLEAEQESKAGLRVLGVNGGLQEMLAAQMLSIHQLQQISITMANRTLHMSASQQYFANAAIKLANTFVQQANLLSKLQGNGEQKIVVEHVDVHQGGQAVVGNINGFPADMVKK